MPRAPSSRDRRSAASGSTRPAIAPTYSSAEEALDAGVESEERAERLAYGVKARRAYEKAMELYETAMRFNDAQIAADATYNAARVLYVLATSFYMPSDGSKMRAFQRSIELYRRALAGGGGSVSSDFAMDVATNLALAMQGYVEICVDLDAKDGLGVDLLAMVREAVGLLQNVSAEQEVVLSAQLADEMAGGASVGTDEGGNGGEAVQPDAASASAPPASTSEYSSSLIVPSSLLEGYLTTTSLLISACSLATTPDVVQQASTQIDALLSQSRDFVARCNAANDWGQRASPDDDWARAISELTKTSIEAQVTLLSLSVAGTAGAPSEAGPQQLDSLARSHLATIQAMATSKDALVAQAAGIPESRRRAFWQIQIEEMIAAGDRAVEMARLLIRSDSSFLRLSWQLATTSSQLYLLVTSLLDTKSSAAAVASAAVLGSSQSANATTLLRCQVLTCLSDVSMLRAHDAYASLTSPAVVNAQSRTTIVDNARVYARRALADVGLEWAVSGPLSTPPQALNARREIPPGGWDAVQTQSEALLTFVRSGYVRARWYRGGGGASDPAKVAQVESTAQEELKGAAAGVRVLGQGGRQAADDSGLPGAWALALDPQRWLRSLIEEEGEESVDGEERAFWQQWGSAGGGGVSGA